MISLLIQILLCLVYLILVQKKKILRVWHRYILGYRVYLSTFLLKSHFMYSHLLSHILEMMETHQDL